MAEQLTDRERFHKALESLNSTQRQSVLSDADTLQVLAGPGSGKTRGKLQYTAIRSSINTLCISSYIESCISCY